MNVDFEIRVAEYVRPSWTDESYNTSLSSCKDIFIGLSNYFCRISTRLIVCKSSYFNRFSSRTEGLPINCRNTIKETQTNKVVYKQISRTKFP